MHPLFLFLLLGQSAGHGKEVMKRILPTTLTGQSAVAVAAFMANKDIERQEQVDKEIIEEVVKNGGIANAEALKDKFPKLHDLVYLKLPLTVQNGIFSAGAADTGRSVSARKPGTSP
jgi:hypothetical protein